LPISTNQLKIFSIVATVVGVYGLAIFVQTNSPIFLFTQLPIWVSLLFFGINTKLKINRLLPRSVKMH